MPDGADPRPYSEHTAKLVERALRLKKEVGAVILAHNYQRPEVQDTADFIGDSLGLSMQATKVDCKYIVFCGVDFMAESAAVLNPGKVVLHPDPKAGCPMAAMVDVEGLDLYRARNPGAAVVAYVNTSAAVKTRADICCTSANAVKVVMGLPDKEILFIPDTFLGMWVEKSVPGKVFHFWPGYCPTHHRITAEEVAALKALHPGAEVLVHPECTPDATTLADHVLSTEGMVKRVGVSQAVEFILGTESGLIYRLLKMFPGKRFYAPKKAVCPTMKRITIEKVIRSMETLSPRISLPQEVMEGARRPLERMVAAGRGD